MLVITRCCDPSELVRSRILKIDDNTEITIGTTMRRATRVTRVTATTKTMTMTVTDGVEDDDTA